MDVWLGVDFGNRIDYRAVSVLSRGLAINSETGLPMRDSRGWSIYDWQVRSLLRFDFENALSDHCPPRSPGLPRCRYGGGMSG